MLEYTNVIAKVIHEVTKAAKAASGTSGTMFSKDIIKKSTRISKMKTRIEKLEEGKRNVKS